jgi:CNT family concentrative nucleoside transporter
MLPHLLPIAGIATILGTMYLWSEDRKNIPWRMVFTLLGVEAAIALVFLDAPGSTEVFALISAGAQKMSDFAMEHMRFNLGAVLADGKFDPAHPEGTFIFAFHIFAMIVVICGICEMLYYLRVLQILVKVLGFGLKKLGLGGAEALSCAATPFLGQVEAQLVIKHFVSKLTPSALLTCMTTSMASTAGSALLLYMSIGLKPQYLITASFMHCFSGIINSKIKRPPTKEDILAQVDVEPEPSSAANIFEAAEHGAMHGAKIAFGVIVMVGFYIALLAMANALFDGIIASAHSDSIRTFQDLLGVPFRPVAFLISIPLDLCKEVGRLIATGAIFNEVLAMLDYVKYVHEHGLSDRAQLLITCVITLFAHPGSIGIQIGGLRAMAPERSSEIARNAPLAMVIAMMSAWLTACVCAIVF